MSERAKTRLALILAALSWIAASSVDGSEATTQSECRADAEARGIPPSESAFCESLEPDKPRPRLRVFEDGSAILRTARERCAVPAYDSRRDRVRCRRKRR